MLAAIFVVPAVLLATYFAARRLFEAFRIGELGARAVLITGCDTGFGHFLAFRCINVGMPVFAACLTQEGSEQLVNEARKMLPNADRLLVTFLMDVSDDASVQKARSFVEAELTNRGLHGLHGIVNNAGIVGNCSWDDWLKLEDYERVWNVNTFGLIRVTHAFKSLVKRVRGRIVNTASVCGRVALPGLGPYSISKYAVEAYTDTIRLELGQFGVRVCLLEPGFFKTPLTDAQRQGAMIEALWNRVGDDMRKEYGEQFFQYTLNMVQKNLNRSSSKVEMVVDAYFNALTSVLPRPRYHVGHDSMLGFIPFSLLPTQIQDAAFWLLSKIEKAPLPRAVIGG